jgi:hypothetical protein
MATKKPVDIRGNLSVKGSDKEIAVRELNELSGSVKIEVPTTGLVISETNAMSGGLTINHEGKYNRISWHEIVLPALIGGLVALAGSWVNDYFISKHAREQIVNQEYKAEKEYESLLQEVYSELDENMSELGDAASVRNLPVLEAEHRLNKRSLGKIRTSHSLYRLRQAPWKLVVDSKSMSESNPVLQSRLSSHFRSVDGLSKAIESMSELWVQNILPDQQGQRAVDISEVIKISIDEISSTAQMLKARIPGLKQTISIELDAVKAKVELLKAKVDQER